MNIKKEMYGVYVHEMKLYNTLVMFKAFGDLYIKGLLLFVLNLEIFSQAWFI